DSRKYTHTDVEPSAASSSHTCRSTDATGPDTPCADTGDPTNTNPTVSINDANPDNHPTRHHRRPTHITNTPSLNTTQTNTPRCAESQPHTHTL
ncbi:MAG: hypothetical protein FWJ87_14105, partial [Micromonosporaceae bacterium]